MSNQLCGNYDTLYDIDERYHLCETDANLAIVPERYGTRQIGVAIVGVGRMGAIHLYNVLREPRARLLYILDASRDRLNHMAKKYFLSERGIKIIHMDDWQQVLNDQQVEACLISTPTFTHEHYTRTALEAGKHVLCEKPLAESLEQVSSLVKLALARDLKLICAFQRRYDPSFRRIKQSIKRGDIGPVRIIKSCSRDSPLPPIEFIRISGGLFHDCCVHDLDVVIWLADELPIEAHAYAHAHMDDYKTLNDFDTAVVSLKFQSGLMAMIDLSRVSATGYEQRVEAYGPKGVLKLDEMTRFGWEKHTEIGSVKPNQCFSFASRYQEAYTAEIVELFNHIEGNKTIEEIRPGYLQALCKIIHALENSARSNRSIKLEWTKQEIEDALPLNSR